MIYFIVILVFQILVLAIFLIKERKVIYTQKTILLLYSVLAMAMLYFSIIASAKFTDYFLDLKLNSFDLDKDGIFSISEQTEEQKKIMQEVISDTGRNFIPITSLGYCIAYLPFNFILIYIINKYWSKKKKKFRLTTAST